jgi:hypothetical protein
MLGMHLAAKQLIALCNLRVDCERFGSPKAFPIRATSASVIFPIAASLTALMILLFLGSWRSTLIIAISIPLSILSSIIVLSVMGETMNTMTLARPCAGYRHPCGRCHRNHRKHSSSHGLAAIVGSRFDRCLQDCYTNVDLNFNHMHRLCFSRLLTGPAKFLFTPMALTVVFAMLASYVLSRALVPVLMNFMLGPEHNFEGKTDFDAGVPAKRSRGCATLVEIQAILKY